MILTGTQAGVVTGRFGCVSESPNENTMKGHFKYFKGT